MFARGTIEEKIIEIQESKKGLAEEILSGETGSLTSMSREELSCRSVVSLISLPDLHEPGGTHLPLGGLFDLVA